MVNKAQRGEDGNVRRVEVAYKNVNEDIKRLTTRSVRHLVLIHSIGELDIGKELFEMANLNEKIFCVVFGEEYDAK